MALLYRLRGKRVKNALLIEALKAGNPHNEALDEWLTDHI